MALGVVALAVVISVGSAFAYTRGVPQQPDAPAAGASGLYDRALKAYESGDTTSALSYLQELASVDPLNPQAKELRARIFSARGDGTSSTVPRGGSGSSPPAASGSSSSGGKSPSSKPSSAADILYSEATTNVATMLPSAVAGYSRAGLIPADASDVEAPFEPSRTSDMAGKVSIVVLAVHDLETASAASAFVSSAHKAYPKDVADVSVGGVKGKSGSDGGGHYSVSFARGRYAFEVTLTATGATASESKAETTRIAGLFPAARR